MNGTKNPAGQPSIYGANFQAITFAQQNYGYLDGVGTPSPELAAAFDAADSRLGTFLDDLANARVQHSTLVLIGSKQGQGPIDPKTLVVTDPQTVIDGASVPVAYFVGEDGGIVIDFPPVSANFRVNFLQMWLQDPSQAATAKANLLANSSLGIAYVLIGDEITLAGYGSPFLDSRVPDLIIGAKVEHSGT